MIEFADAAEDAVELHRLAAEAKRASYSPYSRFRVGAAVRVEDGSVFTGANLDNASYPASGCAERSAISAAVSAGHRRVVAVAVDGDAPSVSPCGVCRQLMAEFARADAVVSYPWAGRLVSTTVGELLPHSFALDVPRDVSLDGPSDGRSDRDR